VTNPDDIQFRRARHGDVPAIARVLQESKPSSIWSQLGGAVTETYVCHYCTSAEALAVVAVNADTVIGACLGTTDPDRDRRNFYRQSTLTLVKVVAAEVARRPQVAHDLVRRAARSIGSAGSAVRGGLRRTEGMADSPERTTDERARGPEALIATLIVHPHAQGRGVGTALLKKTIAEMALTGTVESCRINTTADNIAAQRSMERAGFERSHRDPGQVSYVRPLHSPT
jgi:ribosomal protein S18 acetylase RimI-like enzyme